MTVDGFFRGIKRGINKTAKQAGGAIRKGANQVGADLKGQLRKGANELGQMAKDHALDMAVGALMFKNGGRVGGKRGAPKKAIVHGGEYVLPANAKPTKAQKAIVAENKRKAKKSKK